MRKRFITVILCMFILPSVHKSADIPKEFESLTTLNIDHPLRKYGFGDITIHFEKNISTVIDTLLIYLDKENERDMWMNGGFGPNRRLIITKINRNSEEEYIIDFSPGMSVDPHFVIFRNNGGELKRLTKGGFSGIQLIVPGDGFLYVSGHTNNTFNQRRKYRIEGDEIVEVTQPFYYAGLESVTNREIKLYTNPEDRSDSNLVATLPKETAVTVLLSFFDEPYGHETFLIKTEFGLVGWAQFWPNELYMWNKPNPVEGLFFNGD